MHQEAHTESEQEGSPGKAPTSFSTKQNGMGDRSQGTECHRSTQGTVTNVRGLLVEQWKHELGHGGNPKMFGLGHPVREQKPLK